MGRKILNFTCCVLFLSMTLAAAACQCGFAMVEKSNAVEEAAPSHCEHQAQEKASSSESDRCCGSCQSEKHFIQPVDFSLHASSFHKVLAAFKTAEVFQASSFQSALAGSFFAIRKSQMAFKAEPLYLLTQSLLI